MVSVRLELLGGFQAASPRGAHLPIGSKKGRALLAYLAVQGRPQSREKLSGVLWSSRERAQAYDSLRHELVEIRRAFAGLSPHPLLIDGDTIALATDVVEADVVEFERLTQQDAVEALQSAARLYRGSLLDGLSVQDPVFEEWLAQQCARFHQMAIGLFDRLTARLAGDPAIEASTRLLALDPLREASHRTVMRVFAEEGQTDLAIRQFESCRDLLQSELAVEPASETQQLYRDIRSGNLDPSVRASRMQPAPTRASAALLLAKPLMAVMPFDVHGPEPELEAVAAGLVDEIITGMARFRLVSIMSRYSTVACKNRPVDVRHLGRETGALYVLSGSLRRSGERMRASVQLVETDTGRELWADRYDRGVADHFTIQDELTQAIIAGIEHVLVAAEHRRAVASGSSGGLATNAAAGWHLFRFTREDNARAIQLLRQAIEANPQADRRHQGLALALGLGLAFGWAERPEETIAAMVAAAERGVSLGEQDAWNHAPLCWALIFGRQFDRAIAGHRRMIELNPNSGVSYGVSALVLSHCGDAEAALELLGDARRMAPQAPFMFNYLCGGAIAHYRLGRYREAVEMAESAGLRRPNYFQPQLVLAAAAARAGEAARAAAALASARRLAPAMNEAWLRPLIPLRETKDFADLIHGLREAGLE